MTAVFCENAADRSAETWERQLARFDRLEFAISDGAKGIAKAVSQLAQARRDDPQAPTLEHGLDVFHTTMEARRVLALHWRRAEAVWEKAEAADLEVARLKQQGIDARGAARAAWHAWGRAIAWFEQVERREAAWRRAHAALDLFGAEGRLNDRRHAELEIAEALKDLSGDDWSKKSAAHEANSVCGLIPIITPRNSSVTSLMLCPHSNIATYCDRHHLLTPRNGRRKFLSPVHVPSIVLQCTSRTPSPSASIAYVLLEPEWSTVTWIRS